MKKYTIDELIETAENYVRGDIDKRMILSMSFLDRWLVYTLSGLYSLSVVGMFAPNTVASIQLGEFQDYRGLQVQFDFVEAMQKRMQKTQYDISRKRIELAKIIGSDDFNFNKAFGLALDIIGLYSNEGDVYSRMYRAKLQDKQFAEKALNLTIKEKVELDKEVEPEVYPHLLYEFFQACSEDGIVKRAEALNADRIRKLAQRVPTKSNNYKTVANNAKKLFIKEKYGDGF